MSDLDQMREKMRKLTGKNPQRKRDEPDTRLDHVTAKRDRRRSARKSKRKGSSYERKIGKKFGAWAGETLRRTPQSGGWHGNVEHGVSGDLVCARKKFPFSIECKKREGWSLEDLIIGVRTQHSRSILEWWRQTVRSTPAGKIATLIFARNRVPDLVMFYQRDFQRLCKGDPFGDFLPHFTFTVDGLTHGNGTTVILALDDLFARVRPPKGCRGRKTWKEGDPARKLAEAARVEDNHDES